MLAKLWYSDIQDQFPHDGEILHYNVVFNPFLKLLLVFVILERLKKNSLYTKYLSYPHTQCFTMRENPKLDRPAVPVFPVGEGFREQSITAKSEDKSITLKPMGQSEFVLTTSAIKSLTWQDISRTKSLINKLLRRFDFCQAWGQQKLKQTKYKNNFRFQQQPIRP